MSYPVARITRAADDVDRGLTAALWRNALNRFADTDATLGHFYFEDFVKTLFANTTDASAQHGWFVQDAAAGGTTESFLSANHPDGVVVLSAATGTAQFGIEAHRGQNATTAGTVTLPTATSDSKGEVVYETRVDLDDADACFVGLTEPIVEFLSSTSTLPDDSDYIGFYRTAAGDLQFVVRNDNDGGTAVESNHTIIAAVGIASGYNKLGFRVNADNTVEIYVNDVKYTQDTSGATISVPSTALPVEKLTQKYAITRGDGDSTTVDLPIDYVATFVGA